MTGVSMTRRRSRWGGGGGLLAGVAVVVVAFWASAAPTLVYPGYVEDYGFTGVQTAMIFASYPVALIGALLLAGNVADALGLRRAALIGVGVLGIGTSGFLFSEDLAVLLAARAAMGIGVGISLGPATTLIATALRGTGANRAGAVVTLATAGGLCLALLVGGAGVEFGPDPLRSGFVLLLGATLAAFVATWWLTRRTPHAAPPEGSVWWKPRPLTLPSRRRSFLAGTAAISAAYGVAAVYLSTGAQFAIDIVRSDNAFLNGTILALSAVSIGVVALLTRGTNKLASLLLWGVLTVLIGQGSMILAGSAQALPLLLISTAIGGAGYSLLFSAGMSLVVQNADAHHAASTSSTAYLIAYAAQASIALTIGAVATTSGLMPALIVGSAVVILLAAVPLMLSARS